MSSRSVSPKTRGPQARRGRSAPPRPPERSLRGLVLYFLKLGSAGFGGPIALVGYMHRDLVAERRWFSEEEYRQALAVGQTMPGPLAAQVAMWLGYLERGALGAAAISVPFILPPFLIVTGVAILYAKYQGLPVVGALFVGVGPAVLAIVAIAAVKLARSTNERDPVLWVIAIILCLATALAGTEIVWLFLAAGAFGAIYYGGGLPRLARRAAGFEPLALVASVKGLALAGSGASLGALALFFVKAGAFTFGSGLAIVPFLQQGLVEDFGWLTQREFVDAVAMGLLSPGPVVIMATFAGYLVFGIVGAVVATAAVFLPVFLFVVVPGRLVRRYERHPRVMGFVKGATAAAAGAIAGAAILIGGQTLTGPLSAAIGLVALALLLQRWLRVPEAAVVALGAAAGLALA
jgi:chromate transporter, chromate ion transporter (CHR) family